jgi:hypothetical protein
MSHINNEKASVRWLFTKVRAVIPQKTTGQFLNLIISFSLNGQQNVIVYALLMRSSPKHTSASL